jgi:hypothetical protein
MAATLPGQDIVLPEKLPSRVSKADVELRKIWQGIHVSCHDGFGIGLLS